MTFQQIHIGSKYYDQARKLRHALFFKHLDLPESILDDQWEKSAEHFVLIIGDSLVSYLRLVEVEEGVFKLSQMVVEPENQGKGFGKILVTELLNKMDIRQYQSIQLAARISAVSFYEKFGFIRFGNPFASKTTGVPHVMMQLLRD